jgi:serine/threonine protein phosphatase PrpC
MDVAHLSGLRFKVSTATDPGLRYGDLNEDAVAVVSSGETNTAWGQALTVVVADGHGSRHQNMSGGKAAAIAAVDAVVTEAKEAADANTHLQMDPVRMKAIFDVAHAQAQQAVATATTGDAGAALVVTTIATPTPAQQQGSHANASETTTAASATTAAIAIVRTGWSGDSETRVYRSRTKSVESLTNPHTSQNDAEVQRVQDSGGCLHSYYRNRFVINVKGETQQSLMMISRSVGHCDTCTTSGYTHVPDYNESTAKSGDVIVVASDGIWDLITNEELVLLIQSQSCSDHYKHGDKTLANVIVDRALEIGNGMTYSKVDNMSIATVELLLPET